MPPSPEGKAYLLDKLQFEVGGGVGGFREEYLQEMLDPVFRHITLKTEEEMDPLSPDALYAGFLGALLGSGVESVDAVVKGLPVDFGDIGFAADAFQEKTPAAAFEDAEFADIFEGLEGLEGWERLKSLPEAEQEAFIETLFEEDLGAAEEVMPEADEWLYADAESQDSFSADARDRLTEIVRNGTIKLQRGFMCFPEGDPLIENSKKVLPKEGFFDVAMHGSPTAVGFGSAEANMSPRLLANIIRHREDYHGENIRLLSCSTGLIEGDNYCFAEELANALGVIVEAPNMKVHIATNGEIKVGKFGEGRMIPYKPNERGRIK